MSSTQVGNSTSVSVELTGNPELRQSVGTLTVAFNDSGYGDVSLSIPDRFGTAIKYDFALDDWHNISDAVDEATRKPQTDRDDAEFINLVTALLTQPKVRTMTAEGRRALTDRLRGLVDAIEQEADR